MEKIRKILKKNKFIFNIWNFFYKRKQNKIEQKKLKGNYKFINNSKKSENLCLILAGYKEYLWGDVFERIKQFVPDDFDVCIVSSGLYNDKLLKICNENNWSYLSVEENKVTLVQNIAIDLHKTAKFIYKLDEDMFITKGFFDILKQTYNKVIEDNKYKPGFVAPLININGYSYRRILEKIDMLSDYEGKFGIAYVDGTPGEQIIDNSEIAKYLWGNNNEILKNIDKLSNDFSKNELDYSICPIRFSIGAILLPRETWENMGKFNVHRGNNMGADEVQLCEYCTVYSRPMIVSENSVIGHFSYGPQTEEMKKYYNENRGVFSIEK